MSSDTSRQTTLFKTFASCPTSRARAGRLRLKHGTVDTPVFMPVGTQGTMKTLTSKQLKDLNFEIILANTYHLAYKPGTKVLDKAEGLHNFMNYHRNILTDSGGFQMVSLLKFAEFTEDGVHFSYPHDESKKLLLTPEKCMEIQNSINSDIMMQLDDVVETTSKDFVRNDLATKRSIRWLDRAYEYLLDENKAKKRKIADKVEFIDKSKDKETELFKKQLDQTLPDRPEQVLYPITQGVLDPNLRNYCLKELVEDPKRSPKIEGGAIGGLSGGEEKPDFCRVILQSTGKLPKYRPRYVMGIGHPIDILVCVALGCDQFDCVWPTRIARMGTVLVRDKRREVNLKKDVSDSKIDLTGKLDPKCNCSTCQNYSYGYLQIMLKNKDPSVCNLLTVHNLWHHKKFLEEIRESIVENKFPDFCRRYLEEVDYKPDWAVEALGKKKETMPKHKTIVSANFLKSNSTSHTTPNSAIAEFADNAHDAKATSFAIDVDTINRTKVLIISDDGYGMDYEGLKNCLNLGFSNTRTSDRRAIGRYGNGFKSSFRRLGSNVIVLSKKPDKGSVSVGLYHEGLLRNSEDSDLSYYTAFDLFEDEKDESSKNSEHLRDLDVIIKSSFTKDVNYFKKTWQTWTENEKRKSKKSATMIFIWDLDENLDFSDEFDIKLRDKRNFMFRNKASSDSSSTSRKYSLRCYLKYIYRVPKMIMFLRNKKINNYLPLEVLSNKNIYDYKPRLPKMGPVELKMFVGMDLDENFEDYFLGLCESFFSRLF